MLELYQAEWCPHSHKVRRRLTELGLDFVAHQVEPEPDERDAMFEATGRRSIPTLLLEDGSAIEGDNAILAHLERAYEDGPDAERHREKGREEGPEWRGGY
jgi:glutathione S-transferase